MLRILSIIITLECFMYVSTAEDVCVTYLEKVNCSDEEKSELHYVCVSKAEDKCSCEFENPLLGDRGWFKACYSKNIRNVRKKKVRKRRQTEGLNLCGTIGPPRPGKVSCSISRTDIKCTGTCDFDHEFIDGASEKSYSCLYSEGIWTPSSEFPPCQPKCNPPCQNGGTCQSVNFCSCSNDYRGDACEYPISLCTISKNKLASHWMCNHTRSETTCDISCHPPDTFDAALDVTRYNCTTDGVWSPPLPPCVQTFKVCDDPGDTAHGRRNISSATFFEGSAVGYECLDNFTLLGEAVIRCMATGQWSSMKPHCVPRELAPAFCPKPSAPKNSLVHLTFPDQSPLKSVFSKDVSLSQMLYIINYARGEQKDFATLPDRTFVVGTRVQYKCKSRFYKLYGSEYQTCQSSRTWSGYQPACVPDCGKSDSPKTPFIVNGNSTRIGQWPWQIGLAIRTNTGLHLLCGGVLISELWILTAAHCVTKKLSNIPMATNDLLVFSGKYFRSFERDDEYVQVKRVRQIIIHDEYDFVHFDGDIALIQLESPVELTTRVQPICLPTEDTSRENIRDGKTGIVTGWGLTENGKFSETLKETVLPVVSHDRCEEAYREGLRTVTITKNMYCAGHVSGQTDTCNGDSGGPMMFAIGPANDNRWYLEGIVSWGSESGCAKSQRYSGFTKVGRFVPWINMYI